MQPVSEEEALKKTADLLADWLKVSKAKVRLPRNYAEHKTFGIGNHAFVIQFKATSSSAQIYSIVRSLKERKIRQNKNPILIIAVPFMGEAGIDICRKEGVSWLDLSGNADISAPGLRILIKGQPNLFKSAGRPSSPFAPKSARIARLLLMHPGRPMSQREIATESKIDEGFTSRIVAHLEADGLITRKNDGRVRVPNPDFLLDAWREAYHFQKNLIIKGHMAERSSDQVLRKLSVLFKKNEVRHAATGLSAAWLYTRFAGFRTVTFYLDSFDSLDILTSVGFRQEQPGANVWIVIPKDEGVFQGSKEVEGIPCVHPVQVYIDLSGHPERAKEAADQIRHELLKWNQNA
jgi:hypothetical protein